MERGESTAVEEARERITSRDLYSRPPSGYNDPSLYRHRSYETYKECYHCDSGSNHLASRIFRSSHVPPTSASGTLTPCYGRYKGGCSSRDKPFFLGNVTIYWSSAKQ